MAKSITIRPPTFSSAKSPAEYRSPTVQWMAEKWHVTHSSLPMWKSKRNVWIEYTPLPPSSSAISQDSTDRIDDLVSYQSMSGDKIQTVRGIDKLAAVCHGGEARDAWDWRGKGMLKIAASHWEVLGWGEEKDTGMKWMVTMFAKTLFTPAGIDVYAQHYPGLKEETVADIKAALSRAGDEHVEKTTGKLFEIKHDKSRLE
jgi:hypothetical protein